MFKIPDESSKICQLSEVDANLRSVKGVVIGQLLVSVVGLGQMFGIYSRSFLMNEFWALTIVLFAFALGLSELVGMLEKRVEYYALTRS